MNDEFKKLPPEMKEAVLHSADCMADAMSVEQVKALLAVSAKGQVLNTPGNYKIVFLSDPLLKGAFCYNLLTNRIDIVKPLGWKRDSEQMTDVDTQYLMLYLDEHYHLSSEKKIEGAIMIAANEYRYHPIRNYLDALQWDGQERVRLALRHFLGADSSDYVYEALRMFMLGAVTRIYRPGTKFEVMLCLVGGQGAGKSTFLRFLSVRDEWFSDDLRRLEDENVYRKLQGHWIIEMPEMIATANAKSIEDIKSFLSRQKDTYKVPYAVHPKDYKRQCVFAGTSNTLDFLPLDRTGNRRFLPIMVQPERAEIHILENEAASRAYIDQMWAEIMTVYRQGNFKLKLSRETECYLRDHQKEFMPEDTQAMRILNYLDTFKGRIVCSLQLYYEALEHPPYDEPKQYEIRDINSIMNNYAAGWKAFENPRHFPGPYKRQKGWERIQDAGNGDDQNDGFQKVTEEEARQMEIPAEWLKP